MNALYYTKFSDIKFFLCQISCLSTDDSDEGRDVRDVENHFSKSRNAKKSVTRLKSIYFSIIRFIIYIAYCVIKIWITD